MTTTDATLDGDRRPDDYDGRQARRGGGGGVTATDIKPDGPGQAPRRPRPDRTHNQRLRKE